MYIRRDAAAVRFDTSPLVDDRSGSVHPIKARFCEARAYTVRDWKKKREKSGGGNRTSKTGLTKKRVMNY